jgi:putative membrane protein
MSMDPGIPNGLTGLEGWLIAIPALLVSLAFQVAITALGVVVAWRWLHRPGGLAASTNQRQKNAFEILDERYARGEIDAQEYEERRERLLGRNA